MQKEALVLRGYRLHVSPARERRIEVLERQQSEVFDWDHLNCTELEFRERRVTGIREQRQLQAAVGIG